MDPRTHTCSLCGTNYTRKTGKPLTRVTIRGYKSIRELNNFEMQPLNILIGANGSGKSNLIGLFEWLHQILSGKLQLSVAQAGGADSLLYFGQKQTEQINLSFEFGSYSYSLALVPAKGSLIIASETVSIYDELCSTSFTLETGQSTNESMLSERKEGRAEYVLEVIASWQVYHFQDTGKTARVKQPCPINDNSFFRQDASNLAAFLFLLKEREKKKYDSIVETIRLVAPFFDDFILRPSPLNPETIRLEWRERGSDAYFDTYSLSDGTLRFICLAVLLLQPVLPDTILLDEPELGLHPFAITVLAELLKQASKKTQLIVATQSVTLVNQFGPEDIIVVDLKGGESIFHRPSRDDISRWLDNYSLGELWEKNVLGGRPGW